MLDGKPVARAVEAEARDEIGEYVTRFGELPALAAVTGGHDPAAAAYLRSIQRACGRIGLPMRVVEPPADVDAEHFRRVIAELNADDGVAGIIVLQPLPGGLPTRLAAESIAVEKDVDGITPASAGRLSLGLDGYVPSTPAGGMAILRHYDIPLEGRHAVVLGRSPVVGRPMSLLLLAANATVTTCHSRTPDIARFTRQADILASATGKPGLVTPDMVKPGATVVDFGINEVDDRIVGDVDPRVADVAGAITPVPGGTGTVTTALLVRQTVRAAVRQATSAGRTAPTTR